MVHSDGGPDVGRIDGDAVSSVVSHTRAVRAVLRVPELPSAGG